MFGSLKDDKVADANAAQLQLALPG